MNHMLQLLDASDDYKIKNKFHICIILIGEKVSIQNLFSESENCISFFRGWFPLQPVNRDGLLNSIPKDIKRNKK